ncbi:MAG: prepilin-type N-terminal cleavage/methylation domain-containing protein [Leptolyngbya sp. SIO4C5]|nr:prepilin-type N-terminal cleavage/methylation domain-containing protein [Leptolyngbya sp. SIO4C5]
MNFSYVPKRRVRILADCSNTSLQGFTLIELLVVIIVLGILSAIALPTLLNQAQRAKQADAQSKVGAILRGQQAYYMEHSQFANRLEDLGIGISPSASYHYDSDHFKAHQTLSGQRVDGARARALPQNNLKGYTGKIWIETEGSQPMIYSVICEGDLGAKDFMQSRTYCP